MIELFQVAAALQRFFKKQRWKFCFIGLEMHKKAFNRFGEIKRSSTYS